MIFGRRSVDNGADKSAFAQAGVTTFVRFFLVKGSIRQLGGVTVVFGPGRGWVDQGPTDETNPIADQP
jgi:hypothetical protein